MPPRAKSGPGLGDSGGRSLTEVGPGQNAGTGNGDSVDNAFKETICKGVTAELHPPKFTC